MTPTSAAQSLRLHPSVEDVDSRVEEVPLDAAAADVDADVEELAVGVHRVERGVAEGPLCSEEKERRDDVDHRGYEVVVRRRPPLLLLRERVVEARVEPPTWEQVAELPSP